MLPSSALLLLCSYCYCNYWHGHCHSDCGNGCHCDCHYECDCTCEYTRILQQESYMTLKGNASRYASTHGC